LRGLVADKANASTASKEALAHTLNDAFGPHSCKRAGASPASWEARSHPLPRAWRPRSISYAPLSGAPSSRWARHSEMTANLLTGNGPDFRDFSEWVLIDVATRSDLQSAPFATRDTPPSRRVPKGIAVG
jgi:hypothetical protein